ncbi:hypothetical protein DPMN_079675 [Dreissena polymorpha]|uniref:Uncharacterized protein n=1 Tax=Dreissena polymorpha TaxID=45954 RepID=A0A9D3YR68_DREPO|nr:hypothetical protein DPMN_079675 [Dreissena polymorpha]
MHQLARGAAERVAEVATKRLSGIQTSFPAGRNIIATNHSRRFHRIGQPSATGLRPRKTSGSKGARAYRDV